MSSLLYIGKLTTFQQLDFTNGKTASVFLQLHIWLSLLLHGAEAGSPASVVLLSLAAPWDRPAQLGCEGHRLPRQLEARSSSAYVKHPSQRQFVGENAQTCI